MLVELYATRSETAIEKKEYRWNSRTVVVGRTQGYCGFVVMYESIWSDFEYSSSWFLLWGLVFSS